MGKQRRGWQRWPHPTGRSQAGSRSSSDWDTSGKVWSREGHSAACLSPLHPQHLALGEHQSVSAQLGTDRRHCSRASRQRALLPLTWTRPSQGLNSQKSLLLLPPLSHFSHVRLCVTPETAAHQAPPSLGFSRQEHWNGLAFPSPMHESESEVAQSCLTLSDPMDCSLPGSSVHGIFQARVLEWGAIAFSNRNPQMRANQAIHL